VYGEAIDRYYEIKASMLVVLDFAIHFLDIAGVS
jgi:hypothetical protein